MHQIVLKIDENRLAVFLQFLQTLNYVQIVDPPRRVIDDATQSLAEGESKTHFLADLAGSLSGPDGDELADIVSREFQEIEGEW